MKNTLLLGLGVSLAMAAPAMASPDDTHTLTINGVSPNVCLVQSVAAPSAAVNATFDAGGTDAATSIAITQLADPTNADLNAASISLTFSAMCNGAHGVTLSSQNGGLLNASASTNAPVAGSGSFIRKVGYSATYTWAGGSSNPSEGFQFNNDVGSGGSGAGAVASTTATRAVTGANDGDFVLSIDIDANTLPVVEGSYSDILVLTIASTI